MKRRRRLIFTDVLDSSGNARLPAEEVRIAIRSVHVPIPDYLLNILIQR